MNFVQATTKEALTIKNIANSVNLLTNETEEQIKSQLENPTYQFWLAVDNEQPVGFISLQVSKPEADVLDVAVLPDHQSKGVGKFMIEQMITKLSEFAKISLEVRRSNQKAIRLYEKSGFQIVFERKNYYQNPSEDGLIMIYENKSPNINILSFESSADETSVAVVQNGGKVLANVVATQINSHQRFGGIVPEVASRHHLEWINKVLDQAIEQAGLADGEKITAVAATYGPGLVGSLLVGLMAGKTYAQVNQLPFIGVNHLAGHILAANFNMPIEYPALALMVSGGHTQLVWMENSNSFKIVGATLDDAAGEAFDKIGRVMGLKYPAGKEIQELASQGKVTIDFPIAHTQSKYDFSFSGLKSSVINYLHHSEQTKTPVNKNDLLSSFQNAVVKALITKTDLALQEFSPKMLVLGGGVAANKELRDSLEDLASKYKIPLNMVPIKYAGDNAAMIGAAGFIKYQRKEFSDMTLDTDPSLNF